MLLMKCADWLRVVRPILLLCLRPNPWYPSLADIGVNLYQKVRLVVPSLPSPFPSLSSSFYRPFFALAEKKFLSNFHQFCMFHAPLNISWTLKVSAMKFSQKKHGISSQQNLKSTTVRYLTAPQKVMPNIGKIWQFSRYAPPKKVSMDSCFVISTCANCARVGEDSRTKRLTGIFELPPLKCDTPVNFALKSRLFRKWHFWGDLPRSGASVRGFKHFCLIHNISLYHVCENFRGGPPLLELLTFKHGSSHCLRADTEQILKFHRHREKFWSRIWPLKIESASQITHFGTPPLPCTCRRWLMKMGNF